MATRFSDYMVGALRRAIGDTDATEYLYSDDTLKNYLLDAVSYVSGDIGYTYTINIYEENNGTDIITVYEFESDIPREMQIIFVLKAHIIILNTQPDFSYRYDSHAVSRRNRPLVKDLQDNYKVRVNEVLSLTVGMSKDEIKRFLEEENYWRDIGVI